MQEQLWDFSLQPSHLQRNYWHHSYRPLTEKEHRRGNAQAHSLTKLHVSFGKHATLNPWGIHTKPIQTVTLLPLGSVPHLGPVEYILHWQHGDDRQHLLAASQMYRHDQHLTQHRLQGEFCHLQETCFKAFSEKSWVFSVQKKAMPFLTYLLSKEVCLTQNNFTQHEANYLSVFTITRISQYLQEIFGY